MPMGWTIAPRRIGALVLRSYWGLAQHSGVLNTVSTLSITVLHTFSIAEVLL